MGGLYAPRRSIRSRKAVPPRIIGEKSLASPRRWRLPPTRRWGDNPSTGEESDAPLQVEKIKKTAPSPSRVVYVGKQN